MELDKLCALWDRTRRGSLRKCGYELSAIQNWPLQIESPPKLKYHLGAGRAAYAVGWGG